MRSMFFSCPYKQQVHTRNRFKYGSPSFYQSKRHPSSFTPIQTYNLKFPRSKYLASRLSDMLKRFSSHTLLGRPPGSFCFFHHSCTSGILEASTSLCPSRVSGGDMIIALETNPVASSAFL